MGNIIIEDMTNDTEWLKTREEKYREYRLAFLKSFIRPLPRYCPDCNHELTSTIDDDETTCSSCGLVTSGSIEYVGLEKIVYPHGRH